MQVGDTYALAWRHPHLLNATIVSLTPHGVVCDVEHRCSLGCYLREIERTLPIAGRRMLRYDELAAQSMWTLMNPDAVALPGTVTAEKSYTPVKPTTVKRKKRELSGWRLIVDVAHEQQRIRS